MGIGPSGKGFGSLKQRSQVRAFVDAANPLRRGPRIEPLWMQQTPLGEDLAFAPGSFFGGLVLAQGETGVVQERFGLDSERRREYTGHLESRFVAFSKTTYKVEQLRKLRNGVDMRVQKPLTVCQLGTSESVSPAQN
ncbi:hypothetical protein TEA_008721 [Camellia sinensis var. sinensis]|uniref:Uncharacterized protein n=1 Tax=Camellia sinensis var. sinensis TaxID=542762 RepID=A0A4S4E231_CAMSN|nr:hypothetical protein TEA_008721 [Camellia sinensis var. sinensis]